MPVQYTVSPAQKLVLVTATGIVDRDDMDRLRSQLLVDEQIGPGMQMLLEATEVESRLTFTDLQEIAGRLSGIFEKGITRVAVVADSRYAFSLAKTFSVFASNEPVRMKPFRKRENAVAWLTTGVSGSEEAATGDSEPQSIVERDDSLVEMTRRRTPRGSRTRLSN